MHDPSIHATCEECEFFTPISDELGHSLGFNDATIAVAGQCLQAPPQMVRLDTESAPGGGLQLWRPLTSTRNTCSKFSDDGKN